MTGILAKEEMTRTACGNSLKATKNERGMPHVKGPVFKRMINLRICDSSSIVEEPIPEF